MSAEKVFTVQTRIRMNNEIFQYLSAYMAEYNRIYRYAWHVMTSPDYSEKWPSQSAFVTHIRTKFNVLSRTAGTIVVSVKGRINALTEHQKYEVKLLDVRIKDMTQKIEDTTKIINRLKPKVTENTASDRQLDRYRRKKKSLYFLNNKLNKLRQRMGGLEERIKSGTVKLAFGEKNMFRKQYHLKENGYYDHSEWYRQYVKARDKNIDYIGGAYYACGNDICRLSYDSDKDCFNVMLRKEKSLCSDKKDKYIKINGLHFHNLTEYIKQCLYEHENSPHDGSNKNLKPITYRIKRDGGKWYIQLMVKVPPAEVRTSKSDGVIALKYGQGYIQEAETDRFGNLVGLENHRLMFYGQGNKGVTEMQLAIARIVCKAIKSGKSIITEDIDMMTRKTTAKEKKNRQRLSQFDYARFASSVDCSCYKRGAEHEIVNPANTVYIGREKYAESRKLSNLQAAAYVAARVGQGFSDKINGKSTYIRKIKKAA